MEEWCIDPHILGLGNQLESSSQFHAQAALPTGKVPPVLTGEEAEWAQDQYGRSGEEKNLAPTGTRTPTPWPSSP
jgi:hypothetical protein